MLGHEVAQALSFRGIPWVGSDRDVDITDVRVLTDFANGKRIEWIVNCAAYTSVDEAESNEGAAWALNVEGPRNLARVANELGTNFLHVSTDYVFAGISERPYAEDDSIGPLGAYGRTKAEGESEAMKSCRRTLIIRTSWLYGLYGSNFVFSMLRLMNQRDELRVVSDQRGSPTWAADLAIAIIAFLTAKNERFGIYHFTDEGETTWFDFATRIYRLARSLSILARECNILPIPGSQYPTAAVRPAYSVLSKAKIVRDLGIALPNWETSLEKFMQDLASILRTERKTNPDADCESIMKVAQMMGRHRR